MYTRELTHADVVGRMMGHVLPRTSTDSGTLKATNLELQPLCVSSSCAHTQNPHKQLTSSAQKTTRNGAQACHSPNTRRHCRQTAGARHVGSQTVARRGPPHRVCVTPEQQGGRQLEGMGTWHSRQGRQGLHPAGGPGAQTRAGVCGWGLVDADASPSSGFERGTCS
jgi:hypothetical protein